MSGLRFFDDLMHEAILAERRIKAIVERAEAYRAKCNEERARALEHRGDRMPRSFFEANDGAYAARMILGGSNDPR